jgi:hypothetical protein
MTRHDVAERAGPGIVEKQTKRTIGRVMATTVLDGVQVWR